jgi:hypothetical protein
MSTEFLYREEDGGACGLEPYSLHVPGSSGGGPWTLRPKRLQWLTNITTGFKIAAFPNCVVLMKLEHSDPFNRHPGESRGPFRASKGVPACAGMTKL